MVKTIKQNESKSALVLALGLLFSVLLACNPSRARMGQSTMFEDTAMSDASTAFKEKLGGPFKALYVQINKDSVTVRAQDPNQPTNVNEYQYSAALGTVSGPHSFEVRSIEKPLDATLFDFDSVNWATTATLARTAIERVQIIGGTVREMSIERALTISNDVTRSGGVKWEIDVRSSAEHAEAYADPQGKIVKLDLSHTARAANFNLSASEALREAVSQINNAFAGRARVMDIAIYDKSLRFKAQDPKTSEVKQYTYDINGVTNDVLSDVAATSDDVQRIRRGHNLDEILFDFDTVKLDQAPDFGRRALERLGFENARVYATHLQREELVGSLKLLTYWEVTCVGGGKWGSVSYDLDGKEMGTKTWKSS
jgi:hypothetical protein